MNKKQVHQYHTVANCFLLMFLLQYEVLFYKILCLIFQNCARPEIFRFPLAAPLIHLKYSELRRMNDVN